MTENPLDFGPSATIESLKMRSVLLHDLRNWFVEQGYWECQTPVLSAERIVDPNIELFTTTDQAGKTWFLQSSPEACMKRLLAAGADAIFQIGPAMRLAENGARHNPEFTIAEWYKVGDSYHDQMSFVELLVRRVLETASSLSEDVSRGSFDEIPFDRISYDEAFERFAGQRVLELNPQQLRTLAEQRSVTIPESMPDDRDMLLNLLLANLVEPHLGADRPQFLYDYPDTQAALSKVEVRNSGPAVAMRFELYLKGVELCNGYQELTDAKVMRARQAAECLHSSPSNSPSSNPQRLLAAIESGIPECSGVALGFDRLVMLALNKTSIAEVLAFAEDLA
jgi:elongation factor P--(R)-beta-lysine ligase